MRTSPLPASWTTAARSSGRIAERNVEGAQLVAERGEPTRVLVDDRGEQRRLRDRERLGHVARVPGAARGDHRHGHGLGDGGDQVEVVAGARPVGIDRREQDLPRAALNGLACPFDRGPAGVARARARADDAGGRVDRDHDRLRAEPLGDLGQQLGTLERGAVDADLVGSRLEARRRGGDRPDAPADRERDRDPFRDAPDEGDERAARLERRRHVEEDELVGARVRVDRGELDGIADVAQADEVDALDDAPPGDVQAGDQTRERHRSSQRAPAAPLFSGWNWTPVKEPQRTSATSPSEPATAAGVTAAYECANQYGPVPRDSLSLGIGSTGAQPILGTRPRSIRTARPGTRPRPVTPPSSSL